MKQCSKCGETKPLTDFYKSKRGINGINPRCKQCCREVHNNWAKQNRNHVNEYSRNWSANNPEKKKQSSINWYYRNREEVNKKSRQYVRDNKELVSAKSSAWKKANPEKVRASTERRRIRKLQNAEYLIRDKELLKIYSSPCVYCGSNKRITLDHVIPVSRGGAHGIGNIVPACISCNSSKHNKTIMEWRKLER